jgi:hypothetical protein
MSWTQGRTGIPVAACVVDDVAADWKLCRKDAREEAKDEGSRGEGR